MRYLITIVLALMLTNMSFGQPETLDQRKFSDCILVIPIDYKDVDKDYEEAAKYENIVILIVNTTGKGKIKSWERGYIRRLDKNGVKSVYFEPMESIISPHQKIAKFPLFGKKNTHCYNAECYDKKRLQENEKK